MFSYKISKNWRKIRKISKTFDFFQKIKFFLLKFSWKFSDFQKNVEKKSKSVFFWKNLIFLVFHGFKLYFPYSLKILNYRRLALTHANVQHSLNQQELQVPCFLLCAINRCAYLLSEAPAPAIWVIENHTWVKNAFSVFYYKCF